MAIASTVAIARIKLLLICLSCRTLLMRHGSTAGSGILNDPNDLAHHNEEWQLFHQFNCNVSYRGYQIDDRSGS